MSDLEDVLEMLEISDLTTVGEIEASAENLQTDWSNPKISLDRNMIIVTTQSGRVIGYGELFDTFEPFIQSWLWSRVHPEFEGQGIGTYLLAWGERTARQSMAARSPEGARVTMDSGIISTYQPAIDLFTGYGMKLKRHFYTMMMELDGNIEAPVLPDNVIIRPMRSLEELPAIVAAMDDAFKDHWGYVEGSYESELAYWQHVIEADPTFDPDIWFLAVDGDEIAGVSLCAPKYGPNDSMGWVNELCVRRPWRRQGVALAMLKHSFRDLYRRGKSKVGLGVDAGSLTGATRLYERAGMHVARRFDVYEKELRPGKDLLTRTIEE
jgi:GNAT superfamily N-acetyltransferase